MDGRTTAATSGGRETRATILSAALELFAEHGFAGTSVRALARASGVRESALYHYFPSKDALFFGLAEHMLARRADVLLPEVDRVAAMPLRAGLTRLAGVILAHLATVEERRFWRIMVTEAPRLHGGGVEARHAMFARPRAAFLALHSELLARGSIRDDVSPEVLMLSFVAPLAVLSTVSAMDDRASPHLPVARLVKEHVELVARAIERSGSAVLNERSIKKTSPRRRKSP